MDLSIAPAVPPMTKHSSGSGARSAAGIQRRQASGSVTEPARPSRCSRDAGPSGTRSPREADARVASTSGDGRPVFGAPGGRCTKIGTKSATRRSARLRFGAIVTWLILANAALDHCPRRLTARIRTPRQSGDGSSCFRRRGSARIRRMVHRPVSICTSPLPRRP